MLAFLDYTAIERIHLGPLAVSPHGIGTAVGFIAGAYLMLPAARRRGITDEQVWAMLTRALVGALIGARVAYVINHFGDFDNPVEWFEIWEGGASLLGGITGGILAGYPVVRRAGLSFWKTMDAAAPGLALGIAIGRIGDLVVADHLGKQTDFFLGYRCTGADTASPCIAPIGEAVHQPALYDMVSASLLLVFLLWLRRQRIRERTLILTFAIWYGTGRFFEDFLRIDETHGTGLSGSQWTVLVTVLTASALLIHNHRSGGPIPDTPIDTTTSNQSDTVVHPLADAPEGGPR